MGVFLPSIDCAPDETEASAALVTEARDAELPPKKRQHRRASASPEKQVQEVADLVAAVALTLAGILGARQYRIYADRMALLQDSLLRASDQQYLLQRGRHFDTYDDYLQLFGLTDVKEYPYFQVHPLYSFLVLWGPEYHHPHWHNDGDSAQMMPTITERWEPADTIPELVALRNSELYYNGRRNRDIRLTFMKGLDGDPGFVFLGAYRFSLTQSDTTHIVWERVADEVNLLHLEALEHLREQKGKTKDYQRFSYKWTKWTAFGAKWTRTKMRHSVSLSLSFCEEHWLSPLQVKSLMKEKFKDWLIIKPCYVVMTW